jgi:plastocyanin
MLAAVALVLGACGGTSGSGMIGPCPSPVNGCTSFTDLRGASATITFANFAYSPKCAEVSVGEPVTFSGDFSFHPLSETCGPIDAIAHTTGGTSMTVTFTTAGTYGYQCDAHHATENMFGAIKVDP